jgi:hypothetical protein
MPMTWTLRHLLDYLDDKLDPEQTRRLGQSIAEHEGAQQIVDRLRQITRKRRLSAPELELTKTEDQVRREDQTGDPNTVAAYLDDQLSPQETADLERLCEESDVYLAEVAACHQIISVGESESVLVPPTARRRMYGLAQGREAIPNRPIKVAAAPPPEYAVDGELVEGEGDLLLESAWQRLRRRASILLPIAALVLVILTGLIVYYLIGMEEEKSLAYIPTTTPPAERKGVGNKPNDNKPLDKPAPPPGRPDKPAPPAEVLTAWPSVKGGFKKPQQTIGWMFAIWSSHVAAGPALPPNQLHTLALGREELIVHADQPRPPLVPEKPAGDKPPPLAAQPPPPTKPVVVRKMVGKHVVEAPREGLLLRRSGKEEWRIVRALAAVNSAEQLLVLPGYRNEVDLLSRMKLSLIGSLPVGTGANSCLETAVMIHATEGVALDLTLERGRLLLHAPAAEEAQVRLRFREQTWELKLPAGAVVAVEASGRVQAAPGPWGVQGKLSLVPLQGTCEVTNGKRKDALPRNTMLVWNSPATVTLLPKIETPAWTAAKSPYPAALKRALSNFNDDIFKKVQNDQREQAWIVNACEEALSKGKDWQKIGICTLGALDQLPSLMTALDKTTTEIRRTAQDTLWHWLGRQPGQEVILRRVLVSRGYRDEEATTLLDLLRHVDEPDRALTEKLLNLLKHTQLEMRDLAYTNLLNVLPPNQLAGYNPTDSQEKIETVVAQIRRRVLGK